MSATIESPFYVSYVSLFRCFLNRLSYPRFDIRNALFIFFFVKKAVQVQVILILMSFGNVLLSCICSIDRRLGHF